MFAGGYSLLISTYSTSNLFYYTTKKGIYIPLAVREKAIAKSLNEMSKKD